MASVVKQSTLTSHQRVAEQQEPEIRMLNIMPHVEDGAS